MVINSAMPDEMTRTEKGMEVLTESFESRDKSPSLPMMTLCSLLGWFTDATG